MATNEHKNLSNANLHVPLDFSTAGSGTVCGKDADDDLQWISQANLRMSPIKMQGYGTTQSGDETGFYEYRAELSDAQSPYEFVSDYGSATMGDETITQKDAFRTDGFVCPLAMSLHTITGWATGSLASDLTIGLAKVTPSDSGATALTPVLLDEMTVTCAGNTRTRSFSVNAGDMTVTTLAQGDIIMPFVKTELASVVYYFNFTIFASITADITG